MAPHLANGDLHTEFALMPGASAAHDQPAADITRSSCAHAMARERYRTSKTTGTLPNGADG